MNLDRLGGRCHLHASAWKLAGLMLNTETLQYAFLLIRSAEGYARLARCRFMRKMKPDYVCH